MAANTSDLLYDGNSAVIAHVKYPECRVDEIAGSKLSLDVACRNFMKHTGASIVDVLEVASCNPAGVVGFTDRGEICQCLKTKLVLV